jgi:predicted nucleotidyltransferase/predicted transcriptional regulator
MDRLMTEPVASALIALDESDEATLTQIAHASGRSLSTVQRAIAGLTDAGVVMRTSPRGPYRFTDAAPRRALRDLAEWRLGAARTQAIARWVRRNDEANDFHRPPATVREARIRQAWPTAIGRIVSAFQPKRIILFGSQARGGARHDSDVDLLVVVDEDVDRRKMSAEVARLLADMPFAKDVLVARSADLEHPLRGSVLADAVREGVTVYGR